MPGSPTISQPVTTVWPRIGPATATAAARGQRRSTMAPEATTNHCMTDQSQVSHHSGT